MECFKYFCKWSKYNHISTDKDSIPCKDKKKKISETFITGNDSTQELDNPSKKAKVDRRIDEKNIIFKKTLYKNNQDYDGGTNDKTREYDDSPSDTDGCEINIDDEHKNE